MRYFQHMTDMSRDPRVRKLIRRHGAQGYGLYNYILEQITRKVETESPIPELEETLEDIAEDMRMKEADVDAVIETMLELDLIELTADGGIQCPKIYKFLSKSATRSQAIRNLIDQYNSKGQDCPGSTRTNQDKSEEQNRTEQNRTEHDVEDSIPTQGAGKQGKAKEFTKDSWEYQLAKLLLDRILDNNPRAKIPSIQSWAKQVDLMIRVDKRSPEEIRDVINWCQADDFWYTNILSTSKLRKQYDQLLVKMKKARGGAKPKTDPSQKPSYDQVYKLLSADPSKADQFEFKDDNTQIAMGVEPVEKKIAIECENWGSTRAQYILGQWESYLRRKCIKWPTIS